MGSPTTKQVRPARSGHAAMRLESNWCCRRLVSWNSSTSKEQVAYAVGDGYRRVRGKIVVALQHALGNLRDLDEVHSPGFGKGDLQFARRLAQQREAGAYD